MDEDQQRSKEWNSQPRKKDITETFGEKDLERKEIIFDVSSKDLKALIVFDFGTKNISIELIQDKEIFSLTVGFGEEMMENFAHQLLSVGYKKESREKKISFTRKKKKKEQKPKSRREVARAKWVPSVGGEERRKGKGEISERIRQAIADGTWKEAGL